MSHVDEGAWVKDHPKGYKANIWRVCVQRSYGKTKSTNPQGPIIPPTLFLPTPTPEKHQMINQKMKATHNQAMSDSFYKNVFSFSPTSCVQTFGKQNIQEHIQKQTISVK